MIKKYKIGEELIYIGSDINFWTHKTGTLLIVRSESPDARFAVQAYYDSENKYYDNFSYSVVRKLTKLDKALK